MILQCCGNHEDITRPEYISSTGSTLSTAASVHVIAIFAGSIWCANGTIYASERIKKESKI
jgi:hypothetical protein